MTDGGRTIAELLTESSRQIDRIDAEVLLCHVLEKNRAYLRTWPERSLENEQLEQFQDLLKRCAAGEPSAYLTGWKEFWSLTLAVTPDTLIPRPDTEVLVEAALERIPTNTAQQIADLGTGSGAIALALAHERPKCKIIATDINAATLNVARENGRRLGFNNVDFIESDWFSALTGKKFQLIASNPPYVAENDPHLEQGGLPFEPQGALTPGGDGLDALRIIVQHAADHLLPGGWLLLEHGYDQGEAVRRLLTEAGYSKVKTLRDMGDQERTSIGRLG